MYKIFFRKNELEVLTSIWMAIHESAVGDGGITMLLPVNETVI